MQILSSFANKEPEPNAGGWRRRFSSLRNVKTLIGMVSMASGPLTGLSLFLRATSALGPVALLYVSKLLVDEVVRLVSGHHVASTKLWLLLSAEFGLVLMISILGGALQFVQQLLAERFVNYVSLRLLRHADTLDLASLEDPEFHDKLERARSNTNTRVRLLNDVAQVWQQVVTLCSLGAAVVWFSPPLALLLLVSVIPWLFVETRFAMLAHALRRRRTQGNRVLEYLRLIGTSNPTVKEVKLFGLGQYLVDQYRALSDMFYAENRALGARRATAGALLSLCSSAAYYGAYAKILLDTTSGHLSIGTMTFLAAAFTRASGGMQTLLRAFSTITDQAVFLDDLFEFFQLRPRSRTIESPVPAPRAMREGFEFRDVSFLYPGAQQPVLQHINMRITAGSLVALVGASGTGKTTLLKLLTRLYDPSSGIILLDGVDLREYDIKDLWSQLAVIFQDHVRYDMSFRENIGFGNVEYLHDDQRLIEAARKSQAGHLIERFPDGLNQLLGRRFSTGVDLSAGEWQRVALARAYLRRAQMVILDEPTGSLDARSEYEVFSEFSRAVTGCTALLISHRLSTARMADHIFVLDNGQIGEQGTHDELLARGGRYADLFRLQATGYH